ncbi:MAG: ABC transporter permease [Glutamicibacter arilaitensis]
MALLTPQRERSTPAAEEKNSLGYRTKIILRHPATLLGVLLLLVFGYLIVAPVISLLLGAVQVGFGDEAKAGAGAGSLTGYYLDRVFSSPVSDIIFYTPLLNTLWISLCSMVIALALGVPVAWLLVRTDLPARRWFSSALIVPYMLPAWTFALAWTTIFRNRSNAGQQGWMETLGWEPPNWLAYGPVPIIVIFSLHFTPFVILLVTNALKNLPGQLDEAARICGASAQQRWWRITLPLLRPALLSAATLMFAKAIGEFGVAYVLGLPAGFQVLSTTLHQSISTQQSGIAAVIAAVMVGLGGISLLVDLRFLREAKRFTTLNGKATLTKTQPLARWRTPALVMVGGLFTISVLIPLGTLVLSTIMRVPGDFSLQNFTADYWIGHDLPTVGFSQGVLVSAATWRAMWNTLWMVGLAALCTGLLGLLVGYVVVRSPLRQLGTALRVITFMPYLVPGLAFAVAYLSLLAVPRGPIPALYGTATILILIMIADEMPFASRAGVSAMMQLGLESEEAAQSLGAKFSYRLRTVVLPMVRSSLATATLLPFVSGVQGLSLVIILATPGTELMTTLSMTLIDFGYTHAANAVVVLICAIALLGTWATQKLFRSNLADSLG